MLELINTSLPNGLIAGTHGFATVAMTKGLPDALRRRLEALCAYTHKTSAHDASYYAQNPVNWLHVVLPQGEHVVGRVAASEFDYTGRTNRLARLLVFSEREMPAVGAAAVLQAEAAGLSEPWGGDPRYLAADKAKAARLAALQQPANTQPAHWTGLFGPDGAQLAQRFAWQLGKSIRGAGKPIYFRTSAAFDQDGTKLLGLFADLIGLLPVELRASVTFSTYPDALPAGTNCLLRGAFDSDRSFAIASSTQPWVDCEHARAIHAEMLPLEAPQTDAAPAPAATQNQGAAEAASGGNAPRQRPQPSASQQRRPYGGDNVFLPPPRRDDRKFVVIVAACVVTILVLAAGIFLVVQDRAMHRSSALEQTDVETQAQQTAQSPEDALIEYKVSIGEITKSLPTVSDIKDINKSDELGSFSQKLEEARSKRDEAKKKARESGVADDNLTGHDNKLSDSIAKIETAICERRKELQARKAAEAAAEAKKKNAEAESKEKEVVLTAVTDRSSVPADTRPTFFKAVEVVQIEKNDLGEKGFLTNQGQSLQVFFYADLERKDLQSTIASNITVKGKGNYWSPKPVEILKQSKCLFSILYCEADKKAYWLWNLPQNADEGEPWFASSTNGKDKEINLEVKVFGNSKEAFSFYNTHFGNPSYKVSRSNDDDMKDLVELQMQTMDSIVTLNLFKPEQGKIEILKEKFQESVDKANDRLATLAESVSAHNSNADEFNMLIENLVRCIEKVGKLNNEIRNIKKQGKKNAQNKLQDMQAELKQAESEKSKQAQIISAKAKTLFNNMQINSSELIKCKDKRGVVTVIRRNHTNMVNEEGKVIKRDIAKERGMVQAQIDAKQKHLDDFVNDPSKFWKPMVVKSRYAVTEVVGVKKTSKVASRP